MAIALAVNSTGYKLTRNQAEPFVWSVGGGLYSKEEQAQTFRHLEGILGGSDTFNTVTERRCRGEDCAFGHGFAAMT